MKKRHKWLLYILLVVMVLSASVFLLARKPIPERIVYGMSFNTIYADELG